MADLHLVGEGRREIFVPPEVVDPFNDERQAMLETWARTFKRWTFDTPAKRHIYDREMWFLRVNAP